MLPVSAIVIIFIIGILFHRRKRQPQQKIDPPLYSDDPEQQKEDGDNETKDGPHWKKRVSAKMHIHSRILAYFPFLVEVGYWQFIYWVWSVPLLPLVLQANAMVQDISRIASSLCDGD